MKISKIIKIYLLMLGLSISTQASAAPSDISSLFEKADKNLMEVYNGDYDCVDQKGLTQKAHLEKKSKLVEIKIENKNLKSDSIEIRQDYEGQTGRTRTLIKNTANQEYYSCHYAI